MVIEMSYKLAPSPSPHYTKLYKSTVTHYESTLIYEVLYSEVRMRGLICKMYNELDAYVNKLGLSQAKTGFQLGLD